MLLYSFLRSQSNTFVALDRAQGQCVPIPKATNVAVLASIGDDRTQGAWESERSYDRSSTAFELKLAGSPLLFLIAMNLLMTPTHSGFNALQHDFDILFSSTYQKLSMISAKAAERPLPWNYLLWSTYSDLVKNDLGSYEFTLLGDIRTIFNRHR